MSILPASLISKRRCRLWIGTRVWWPLRLQRGQRASSLVLQPSLRVKLSFILVMFPLLHYPVILYPTVRPQFSPVRPPRHQFIFQPHVCFIVQITDITSRPRSVADADQCARISHPLQNFPPSAKFPTSCGISHPPRSHLEAIALRPLPGPRTVSPSPQMGL